MRNFIKIFHKLQEIGPVALFQNLDLGKASTDENSIWQCLGIDLVNINMYAIFFKISLVVREVWCQFHFFPNLDFGKVSADLSVLWLGLVNVNVYAKCYPNIPYGSRVMGKDLCLRVRVFPNYNNMIRII